MSMPHPLRYRLEWLALVLLGWFAKLWPHRLAAWFGCLTGRVVGMAWHRRRNIALKNLRCAFPDWDDRLVEATARATFCNIGRTAFEILQIGRSSQPWLLAHVDNNNPDLFPRAQSLGKGALLLSGHIGNWELFAGWIRAMGYELDVVVKPLRNPLADRYYNARREALGVGIIHTQVATREIVRSLRQNRFVAILSDQYAGEEGIEVTFFGRTVSTPRGPAVLALKLGCPLMTGVFVRRENGRFLADIHGTVEFSPSGDSQRDIRDLTQMYTTILESYIRKYPSQWLWTHRRWRD